MQNVFFKKKFYFFVALRNVFYYLTLKLQDEKVHSEVVDCLQTRQIGGWWRSEIQITWKQSLTNPAERKVRVWVRNCM